MAISLLLCHTASPPLEADRLFRPPGFGAPPRESGAQVARRGGSVCDTTDCIEMADGQLCLARRLPSVKRVCPLLVALSKHDNDGASR